MAAARLFLQYTDGMEPQIVQDVCQRVKGTPAAARPFPVRAR